MSSAVTRTQRWTRTRPCPVCGGYDGLPRGQQIRCAGFLSTDGQYVHCTREERAGGIAITSSSGTYAHRLGGPCQCGTTHAAPDRAPAPRAPAEPVAVYHYHDEQGAHLYDVCRFAPKTFRCRRADGEWSITGVRRVLYRLPELVGHARVYVVEGEKDVDRLHEAGLVATCNPHGARKWTEDYTRQLVAAGVTAVVIFPDADDEGRAHAEQVAASCRAAGIAATIVPLPGVPSGGDVSDYLKGSSPEALLALVAQAQDRTVDRELAELTADAQPEAPIHKPATAGPEAGYAFEDAGSEYVARWPHLDVSLTLRRLRDHSEGMRGELVIHSKGQRLEMVMHSLLAASSRATLAKNLAGADSRITAELWGAMLRTFVFRVHDAMRELKPELLTGECYTGPRFDVWPFALRDELTLMFAPPGTSKSLLACATGLCHVSGVVLPGGIRPREPMVMKRVLFLDSETTRASFDHRIGALCRGWGIPIPPADHLHYLNIKGKVLSDLADAIRAYVKRHGISLVILDSTLWVAGHDRELSDATIGVYNALSRLGVTCLALTHTPKGDGDSPYGNQLYTAGARLVIKVKKIAKDAHGLTVECSSMKGNDVQFPPILLRFEFEPAESYTWIRMGPGAPPDDEKEAGATEPETVSARVLKYLPTGVPRTPTEIASLSGIKRGVVSVTLSRLADEGLVTADGKGRWIGLAEGGKPSQTDEGLGVSNKVSNKGGDVAHHVAQDSDSDF